MTANDKTWREEREREIERVRERVCACWNAPDNTMVHGRIICMRKVIWSKEDSTVSAHALSGHSIFYTQ